jgi:PAS domain-containing protein
VSALATIVVVLIAAVEAPELRWYAPGIDAVAGWLQQLLGVGSGSGALPFAGFYAPSDYFVVLLAGFAILMLACAVAAEYLGTVFERLQGQVAAALVEAERGQQLWSAVLERLPLPALVVDADTCEIAFASGMALSLFEGSEGGLIGRDLFEAVRFSYPELVHELVSGVGGVAKPCMRLALVILEDVTESFCVKAALDVAEHAAIVVDVQGRVRAWNRPATVLFPDLAADTEAARLLPEAPGASPWWEPGLGGRRKAHVTVMQRVYQLTCSAVALPGEDERLYVAAFVPATLVAAAEQEDSTLSTFVRRS